MSTTATKINVNIRLDKSLKWQVEQIAHDMWLTFTAVVNMLLTKLTKERTVTLHADYALAEPVSQDERKLFNEESWAVFSRVMDLVDEVE